MPLGVAFAVREMQHFERMAVGIAKIESFNAAGVLVPVGEPLRSGRCMFDLVLAQPSIGAVHVTYDDRDVLESAVVAVRFDGRRAPSRSQVLCELDILRAEAQASRPDMEAEYIFKVLVGRAVGFLLGYLFERQDL